MAGYEAQIKEGIKEIKNDFEEIRRYVNNIMFMFIEYHWGDEEENESEGTKDYTGVDLELSKDETFEL